jgi:type IV fimbrial biogenesis protein FimT
VPAARGFTLIELFIAMAVAAILATLAAPSFVEYLAAARIRNASYDVVDGLQMARSEAIKRNTAIDMVRTNASSWTGGWKVQVPGAPATVLRTQDAYGKVAISDSANISTVTFGNDGRPTTNATVFKIQPAITVASVTPRCVTLSLSGVPSSKVGGC